MSLLTCHWLVHITDSTSTLSPAFPPLSPLFVSIHVAQPEAPTYYYVTTYDENGNSYVETFLFTPTFAPSSPPVEYSEGTVYDYDSWTAEFVTRTNYPNGSHPRPVRLWTNGGLVGLGIAFVGVIGGQCWYWHECAALPLYSDTIYILDNSCLEDTL